MYVRRVAVSGLALLATAVFAQTPTAEISGQVTDASGALMANVAVVATNAATNAKRTSLTNEEGRYALSALPPGMYSVRAELAGFQAQLRSGVELQVGQLARIDIQMKVGNVTETVEVTAGAPVLQTESTELGTVIENKRILELPLNGRNYLQLASLTPGVTTNGPASSQGQQRMGGTRNSFAMNVSGQRVAFNHFSLDGMENTDPNFNTYLLLPSLEALQEFKVEAGLFQAEYGRAIAQVNVSTRGGTNELRGTLFHFLRNAKLDAKNYFDRANLPKPPFKRNQFGFVVGGPVYIPKLIDGRNKLFFFVNYEGLRERRALTQTAQMPTAAMRAGDLSFFNRSVIDPATRTITGNTATGGTPFPNATIPTSRIHPTSARVLREFYPLPNIVQSGLANNFLNNEGRQSDLDTLSFRGDWVESSNSNWFVRYSRSTESQYLPINIPTMGNNSDVDPWQGVLSNTRVFGANKVNDIRFGVSYLKAANIQPSSGKRNVVAELNIPDVSRDFPLYWGIPVFQIGGGFSNVGECNDCPFVNYDTIIQLKDDFSWTRGKHSFKLGGEARRVRFNQVGAVVPRGRFSWDGRYTGLNMGDYLLGHMSNTEGQIGAPIANFRTHYLAFYLQDTWRVSKRLTLNWGIRWENEPPYYDKHDAIVNVDFKWDNSVEPTFVRLGEGDPYAGNPGFPWAPSVKYVRDGRFGRRAGVNDANDLGPRLGIAYSLNDKTVIRSGFGIYYVRDIGNAVFDVVRNAPFTIRRNEPADPVQTNQSWERPFTITGNPTFLLINQHGERTSYIPQWSFGLQRELGADTSLEVTYVGSSGIKLRRLINYNVPGPGVGNINARRPFPQFGQFQTMNAMAHSTYNALTARLQRRFSKGLTVLGSYAYSKSIDAGSGIRTTDGDPLTPMDPYGLYRERGRSAFDFRQRITTSWLYDLPIGKGRAMALSGPADVVFGGWQLSGILTLQSGFPLSAFCGPGNIQNGGDGCRPDAVGTNPNLSRDQKTPTRFFNTDAFIDRLPGGETFRYGNSGRNVIDGPGIISFDFSVIKNFQFTERQRLEFRAEMFNLPNHPIFAPPGTSLRNANYGVIGATRIDSRQLQFGLKLHF